MKPNPRTEERLTLRGRVFDGEAVLEDHAATIEDGRVVSLLPASAAAAGGQTVDLGAHILAPGFVDLQVNGGGGVMFNDDPSPATLDRIAQAHRSLGTTCLLPTLITDTPETTNAAIDAAAEAVAAAVPGIGGLHLEGPHLSEARKGAHDPGLIRAMTDSDAARLVDAKARLPVLMVTLAPEAVSLDQVDALRRAGVIVSLGHSGADFDTVMAYAKAGATCVTHLFNAMSQMGHRAPGLVGAALSSGALSAGLIADGIHVHPEMMRIAFAAKRPPGRIVLVSDAMAGAGTDIDRFTLNGRTVVRRDGRLTLEDGTLAGADLDLARAVSVLTGTVGVPLAQALQAATMAPAALAGMPYPPLVGRPVQDLIRIDLSAGRAHPIDNGG